MKFIDVVTVIVLLLHLKNIFNYIFSLNAEQKCFHSYNKASAQVTKNVLTRHRC